MSVLDTPRIYFRGEITWDPIVTNNFAPLYDLNTGKPELGQETAAAYRERARQTIMQGNWNLHGTHRSTLVDTNVTGVDRGSGLELDDALVGVPLSFSGMLVDVDPYGATSSQLFFDDLSCGIDGGSQVVARRAGPMVARRINFSRNTSYRVIAGVASVIWQTSFSIRDVSIHSHGSAVLEALAEGLEQGRGRGLTVRINAFRTAYYGVEQPTSDQSAALAARIAAGGFHPNPARSVIVGVIGPWQDGEPPSVPADRVLARAPRSPVSTAFTKVDDDRLTIDLANSVPETGFDLEKLDLGPLSVVSRMSGQDVALGTLAYADYDAAAYRATSGIVEVPLDEARAAAAREGDLEVRGANGAPLLREQPLTVCAEPANVYLEEGEGAVVTLRAFERGKRPSSPVAISLVELGGPLLPPVVETDGNGDATVPIHGGKAGSWTIVLMPWRRTAPPPPRQLVPDSSEYLTVRTLPSDDQLAGLEPTWQNVYENVLRHWEALAPCMDNWLRLGDEEQCRAYAPLLRRLTSRTRFNDYRYMPVTRDLTAGQRQLLHAWCDAVSPRPEPPQQFAVETTDEAAAERPTASSPFGRGF